MPEPAFVIKKKTCWNQKGPSRCTSCQSGSNSFCCRLFSCWPGYRPVTLLTLTLPYLVQQHPQPPFLNVRVSHDSFLAHSEPMLAENPHNPLNLVGGTKFFTDPAHYRFQIGYFASFDGGCTWTDGGVLPGFQKEFTLTSDISFAFGTHNDVYAGVVYEALPGMSGIAVSKSTDGITSTPVAIRQLVMSGIVVSKSTDGGKTFGNPVSVIESQESKIFHDKPWITVDQTNGPHKGNVYVVWSYDYGNDCGQGNP